jgi:hypothetical protein
LITLPETPAVNGPTLRDLFCRPYPALTIRRPLNHFSKSLGLTPGVTAVPSCEVLTKLLMGAASHQAAVRQQLNRTEFQDLANFVRGAHEPLQRTLDALGQRIGVDQETLSKFKHGNRDGPLLPLLLEALQAVEGFFSFIFGRTTEGVSACSCCGANVLDDVDAFWTASPQVRLEAPEYQFVERALASLLGWRMFRLFLNSGTTSQGSCFSTLPVDPANPAQYPVSNWLHSVRQHFGCANSSELEKRLASLPDDRRLGRPLTQLLLNKWACGENLVPLDRGVSLVRAIQGGESLRFGLMEARALAFIHEFVGAAGEGSPPPTVIRAVVFNRMEEMSRMARFNLTRLMKQSLSRSSPHAAPDPMP